MKERISLIIPTYKRREALCMCLQSIPADQQQVNEIIIVDQSPDNKAHAAYFTAHFPSIHYICLSRANLPHARNVGILNSRGTVILFIDDDTVIDHNCIAEHVRLHSRDHSIGAVAGRIKQCNSNVQWAPGNSITHIDSRTGETRGNFDCDYEDTVLYASGGHMSIKRHLFEEVGLFNPSFKGNALFEEVDFFIRMRKKGYTVHYCPRAIVYHYPREYGGCHHKDRNIYLMQRLYNHTLFYTLHIHRVPRFPYIVYTKNMLEFISRTNNANHSIIKILRCVLVIIHAYGTALLSFVFFNKYRHNQKPENRTKLL